MLASFIQSTTSVRELKVIPSAIYVFLLQYLSSMRSLEDLLCGGLAAGIAIIIVIRNVLSHLLRSSIELERAWEMLGLN